MDLPPEIIQVTGTLDLTEVHPVPIPPPSDDQVVGVMVDLETWGTGNKALPVSIGAVKFSRDTIVERFHIGINPESITGMEISPGTIMWWMDPERDAARAAWLALEKVDFYSALHGFQTWLSDTPDAPLWGNGSTFDNVILRSAFEHIGLDYPVRFWNDRCYRTVKALRPDIKLERVGVHHDACDDAASQALHLIAIANALGVKL